MEAGVGIEPAYVELQSTAWPLCHPALKPFNLVPIPVRGKDGEEWQTGAGNETRTRDPDLGKVVLYQLSYSRIEQFVLWYFHYRHQSVTAALCCRALAKRSPF
jgi:hypothetical protein